MSGQQAQEIEALPLEGPEQRLALRQQPAIAGQYLRALARAGRPRGRLRPGGTRPAPIAVEQEGRRADPAQLAGFRALCGHPEGGALPCAFVETLFQALLVELVLSPQFPLSPFGLVHLRQRLEGPRSLDPAPLDLRCQLAALRRTPRGIEVDCAMSASGGAGPVWAGLATLLSRDAAAGRGGARGAAPVPVLGDWSGPVEHRAEADTGRRYAAVSGDWNPFHLHALLARPFGFPRAIAHGMWTLGWALAQAERAGALPERFCVEAAFKRPLLLPGSIAARWRPAPDGLELEVRHPEQDLLHLAARITPDPRAVPTPDR